jgi:hypothetical protein
MERHFLRHLLNGLLLPAQLEVVCKKAITYMYSEAKCKVVPALS